ncbi:Protein of unknown function [Bacillus cytotoxicus]|nr:Protein of unknown function [Bacillus cytotoxicus]
MPVLNLQIKVWRCGSGAKNIKLVQ